MSLVPDKVRKAKKLDVDKLDAFVDEGLAKRRPEAAPAETRPAPTPETPPAAPQTPKSPRKASKKGPAAPKPKSWQDGLSKAPSVAFSVRIPTPLLERMRDVVAAVDGETLTSLLVEGATERVTALETSYEKQVGEPLPTRQEKVEL